VIELTEWFANASLPARPWLVLGKGPTFDRRDRFDLTAYNRLSLNHVVNEVDVDVAHIIDVDVVGACAEGLRNRCRWLLMPRHPHLRSTLCDRSLEDWFGEYPVLEELDREGRLVWYNLSGTPVHGRSPVIGAKRFSAEAALNLLGVLGVRQVRSLGIDGGRAYGAPFRHLADETMLANGANSFDDQFERLAVIVAEHGIDYQPLVEPLRIFVGTDESQVVAHRVLEYSIRKSASIPVEVTPTLGWPHPMPRDPENKPRTTFSFCRFMIPERGGYRGRALYLDADMVVFGDVAELADVPFDDHAVLCSAPPPTGSWDGRGSTYLGPRSVAVMLLDCDRLPWKIDDIVAGLDEHRYTYSELLSDVCVVPPAEIADTIPPEWNELERFEPGRTKLLHYTVVPTQPWKNDDNPLAELWMGWYREAVEAGAVPPEEVEALVRAGHVKPSLTAALRSAPSRRSVLTGASLDLATARRRVADLEARLARMEESWPWRIGSSIVRTARLPRDLARKGRSRLTRR
jgi:hypothetical protein